ncbi:hypothetical protein FNB15_16290 [Ferrovibrio terrae]|uniref:DUF4065 domain-containing protein n=1 Tax=Ferrovibrio terrae TaxID=2594003 RepID=A0A516H4P5_9PROT|nr:hypothetical protein [Ferrovibrio terrae]QDO98739.1 hypothetical protein FNB15_16290 [Ferrovibrio terrae]
MVPATRSGIDVSFWLLEQAATERIAMSLPKLRWLLYLAQAHYAIARDGAKLMPATFLVGDDGPIEPTLDLVFQAGIENPWSPALSETAAAFLEGFWKRFGALPAIALHKLVIGDPAWRKAQENGPGSEIAVDLHRASAPKPTSLGHAPVHPASATGARRRPPAPPAVLPPFEEAVRQKIAEHAIDAAHPLTRAVRTAQPARPGQQSQAKTASVQEAAGHLRAAPPDSQEVRFTADGRSVTRWRPKRRVEGPTI